MNTRPTSCPRGDVVTSWNAQGQIGPQGPVGQASVVSLLPLAAVACPTPPAPSGDPAAGAAAFLSIPNIPGEATDENHVGQINVLSWSWGTSAGSHASCGTASRQGGSGTDSTFLDLTVVKRLDKSSPKLMLAVASGTPLGTVKLSAAKQGTDYLVITMENTLASSLVSLGSNGSDVVPHASRSRSTRPRSRCSTSPSRATEPSAFPSRRASTRCSKPLVSGEEYVVTALRHNVPSLVMTP